MKNNFGLHKKWKQNPVEKALQSTPPQGQETPKSADYSGLERFLHDNYQIDNLVPVLNFICNKFLLGTDKYGRRLFIKTGGHAGIYENEYKMGRALYDIDARHFLEPLYYNDNATYNFFANEYADSVTLKTAVMTNSLDAPQRARMIGDVWRIFCALKKSDVVHRDIRPDNLLIVDGKLVLIDFQLAVSKSNYVELDYLARRPNRLRKLGNKHFRYRKFTWDDAHSLLKVMKFIGRDSTYGIRYDTIYKNIKAHVGKDTIKAISHESDFHRAVRHIRTLRI